MSRPSRLRFALVPLVVATVITAAACASPTSTDHTSGTVRRQHSAGIKQLSTALVQQAELTSDGE